MIGVIATMRSHPGKRAELETALLELSEIVRNDEPGNRMYQVTRSRQDEDVCIILELYDSEEAFKLHSANPLVAAFRPKLGAVIAGAPDVVVLDAVA